METERQVQPVLTVTELAIRRGNRSLLEGVSFSVAQGEIFSIIGASGCGKSSLLRILLGLDLPASGTVRLCGVDPAKLLRQGGVAVPHSYGVLFQEGALWTSMSLLENVSLPIRNYHREFSDEEITDLAIFKLALVGLGGFENFYPNQISGGMARRAAIARAIALDPPVLFLDEPSAGLDPVTARQLDELILQLRSCHGTAVVLITHDLSSIRRISDRAAFLDQESRSLLEIAPPAEMAERSPHRPVRDFFGDRLGNWPKKKAILQRVTP
ncbi:MAG: ATP-binding cassette domain-containing protein [Puniceicoccales bacterium]|jgi:phospholipid/cholesterol/gamma-HCH transport system ATP-binding protein|nr:ATP-binding cassette domain-containing protein [Puniceicoccales bacterium]